MTTRTWAFARAVRVVRFRATAVAWSASVVWLPGFVVTPTPVTRDAWAASVRIVQQTVPP